mmetsp:Transcript_65109/g.160306  ORF Transcript_65109/g.160306 Transcript_65109/m.160306 type:complete len:90 (+) Transcript_65109:1305-1574(+)
MVTCACPGRSWAGDGHVRVPWKIMSTCLSRARALCADTVGVLSLQAHLLAWVCENLVQFVQFVPALRASQLARFLDSNFSSLQSPGRVC